jgi:hypothetical protein
MNAAIPPDHAFHTNNFKIYTSVTYIQSQISQTLELSEWLTLLYYFRYTYSSYVSYNRSKLIGRSLCVSAKSRNENS